MKPIRIAYVIARGDAFGGSSRHVLDMASRLQNDGHEAIVLIGGDPSMAVPQRLAESGVPFRCIPSLERAINPGKDFRSLLALRSEIRRFSPDLVSTHASKGGFLGRLACIGLGVPVLYTPHCWSFVEGFPGARKFRLIEKWMARVTTRIVTVSAAERQFGLSNSVGTPAQTVLIHNGLGTVPESGFRRRDEPSPRTRIVMVGRFEEQKDQQLLLSALAELKHLQWQLSFVGDSHRQEDCRRLADDLGIGERVDFAGYVGEVEQGLTEHDLFALITNWEGFPRSILEAMRAGLPVVTSDVGGCAESVVDGISGRVVAKGSLSELKAAMEPLLQDPDLRERMGRRGFELYLDKFSFETMYQSYISLYASLLAPRRSKQTALAPSETARRLGGAP